MSSFAAQNVVENLGWTLLHFVWQGAVIAAVLAVILRCCNRVSANTRYALGCAALLLLAIAPVATFSLIDRPFSQPPRIKVERDYADSPITFNSEIAEPTLHPSKMALATHLSWNERLERSLPWLVFAWAVGVLVFSLRLAAAWAQINLLKRRFASPCAQPWPDKLAELSHRLGINRPVRLLQSALVEVPSVIGWLRPVILLPASSFIGLSPAQLEAILAHELAHIRRHDYLVNLFQTVLETILFYHPAVWWISRQVRAEREHCCDDLAVEICGDRLNYARALATLEELRQPPAQLVLAANGNPLLRRIQRLVALPPANPSRPAWPFVGILILALLTLIATGVHNGHVEADETPSAPKLSGKPEAVYQHYFDVKNQILEPNFHAEGLASTNITMVKTSGTMIAPEPADGRIHQLLKQTKLEKLSMHLAPLPKVIKQLNDEALARDPAHRGIHFELWPDHAPNSNAVNGIINPELYLGFVTISLPERPDISLADSIDLITLHADFPIQYVIFKDRVVFMKANVETRTFHLAGTALNEELKKNPYLQLPGANGRQLYQPKALRQILSENDVNLITNSYGTTPEAFIWDLNTGEFSVRATRQKLNKIEFVLQRLMSSERTNDIPPGATNAQSASRMRPTLKNGREQIISLLDHIHIDHIQFDHVPMGDVISKLAEIARAQDPGHRGINFMFERETNEQDPATDVRIDLMPGLTNVTLGKLLEAIIQTPAARKTDPASGQVKQLRFSIKDYAIDFSWGLPTSMVLESRFFRLDSNILPTLKKSHSLHLPEDLSATKNLNLELRQFLADVGADFNTNNLHNPGKAFVYNDRKHILWFRATADDLDRIETGVGFLSLAANHLQADSSYQIFPMPGGAFPLRSDDPDWYPSFQEFCQQLISNGVDPAIVKSLVPGETCTWSQGSDLLMILGTPATLDAINHALTVVAKHPNQSLPQPRSPVPMGEGPANMIALLQQIHIGHIQLDFVPMKNVIRQLNEISQAQDPEHIGINFYVEAGTNEPASEVRINLVPGLTNVTLGDLLEAITQTATSQRIDPVTGRVQHLTYIVFDRMISFHWDDMFMRFHSRSFKLNQPLENIVTERNTSSPNSSVTSTTNLQIMTRMFFESVGVDLDTNNPANSGKAFVYNDRKKTLMVRASKNDLDRIEAALGSSAQVVRTQTNWMNSREAHNPRYVSADRSDPDKAAWSGSSNHSQTMPEINLKVKVAVVDEEQTHKAGIDWLFAENQLYHRQNAAPIAAIQNFPSATNAISTLVHPVTNSIISQLTGALGESDVWPLYSRLENTFGVDVLKTPEVTTELTREAMVMAVDQFTVVTGASVTKNGRNPSVHYTTEDIAFGPIVDMVPKWNETNGLIDLLVTASIGEFAGYAEPRESVKGTPEFPSYEKPQPQFHLWQMRTEQSITNTGTLVLVGFSAPETNVVKDNVPVLGSIPLLGRLFHSTTITRTKKDFVILVTPTLINGNGTRWQEPAK